MTVKKLFLALFITSCQFVLAQDSIARKLQEVVISDIHLKKSSSTQKIQKFSDSLIQKERPSLTSFLQNNTLFYFKENGLGMVSSPSYRGTTAQQTAVIWNGVNINSQINGQTDFNTVATQNFNSITVRSGGGSTLYGSSAIGGTIHLNNDLVFERKSSFEVQSSIGSFTTISNFFNGNFGNEKVTTQIGFSRNSSKNDYPFLETKYKNENGEYYNSSLNASLGFKINASNFIKFYSQFTEGERHFSAALGSVSNSKYKNAESRNLLEWKSFIKQITSTLRLAFLSEEYKYFNNKEVESRYSFGEAKTAIAKYDLAIPITKKINLNSIIDYTTTNGEGSDILQKTRKIASATLILKHCITDYLQYELSGRKEITNQYESPFLFSSGVLAKPFRFYHIKFNASKNFRIPSFNDLYYSGLGNPNLKPEEALQAEITHDFIFKNITFSATGYGIKINDLIQWAPDANGVWTPSNVLKVKTYGVEFKLEATKKIGSHLFALSSAYGYTKSINEMTQMELIYVPNHKLISTLTYNYNRFSLSPQVLYTGKVFTSSDNQNSLTDYLVANAMIDYAFGKKKNLKLGAQCLNLINEKYQSVLGRPMPGRNYTLTLNIKF